MALDTEVKGDPGSVTAASGWVKGTVAPAVDKGADALAAARSDAASDWDGPAGRAFAATMKAGSSKADGLRESIIIIANAIDTYASTLRSAQHRMSAIREAAAGAGLAVNGFQIADPDLGPARPGTLTVGPGVSSTAVDAHEAAVVAYDAHQYKIRAWNTAVAATGAVRTDLSADVNTLTEKYRGLSGQQFVLTAADIVGGWVGGALEFNASALRGSAALYEGQAITNLNRALGTDPALVTRQQWYKDLDDAKRLGTSADDLARSADDLRSTSKSLPLKVGGALAVAGIGYDIYAGKDPVQAVASGGGGFLASVGAGAATGAVIGSFVPIPGVGTAAGAIVGAGVGIFTSGAIDSLFENGPDVGTAFDSGVDALEDTGGAIGDGVSAVGGAVSGLFD